MIVIVMQAFALGDPATHRQNLACLNLWPIFLTNTLVLMISRSWSPDHSLTSIFRVSEFATPSQLPEHNTRIDFSNIDSLVMIKPDFRLPEHTTRINFSSIGNPKSGFIRTNDVAAPCHARFLSTHRVKGLKNRTTLRYWEGVANSETRKMLVQTYFFINWGKSTEYDSFQMIVYQLWLLRPLGWKNELSKHNYKQVCKGFREQSEIAFKFDNSQCDASGHPAI
ncbi:ureide permease 4 [Striga asiatica]|uniref:Ureide permease 4 n=1 Tax=Striga asiatica TaxID=4170 RepID=A0A5A7RK47_STRAF|nr:ureide permease 4 [Striga asiatica]